MSNKKLAPLPMPEIVDVQPERPSGSGVSSDEIEEVFIDGARGTALGTGATSSTPENVFRFTIGYQKTPAEVSEGRIDRELEALFTAGGYDALRDAVWGLVVTKGVAASTRGFFREAEEDTGPPSTRHASRRDRLLFAVTDKVNSGDPLAGQLQEAVNRLLVRIDKANARVVPDALEAAQASLELERDRAQKWMKQYEFEAQPTLAISTPYQPTMVPTLYAFKKGNAYAEELRRELIYLIDKRQTTLGKPPKDPAALEAAVKEYLDARDAAVDKQPVIARLAEQFPARLSLLVLQTPGVDLASATHDALARVISGTQRTLENLKDPTYVWRLPPFVRFAAQSLGYDTNGFLGACVEQQIGVAEETLTLEEQLAEAITGVISVLAMHRAPVATVSYRLLAIAAFGLTLTGFEDDMARAATNLDPTLSALGDDPEVIGLLGDALFNLI